MRRGLLGLAALLVLGGAAAGHEGATGVVKQRMDDMKVIGRSLKRIGDRLRTGHDLAAVAAEADAIAAASARMPALYPPGSRDAHTEATAAVWQRWPDFVAASRSMTAHAERLAASARAGETAAASGHYRAVARSCGQCHDAFRDRR